MKRTTGIVCGVALLVGACGGSDDPSGSESGGADPTGGEEGVDDEAGAPSGPADTYAGELEDGSTLTIRLDVDDDDPAVAPFVAFRAEAGATDPVVWIVGTIEAPADFDATLGPPTGRFLTFLPPGADLIDDDATNPQSVFACSRLDEWFGTPTGDAANALNETYIEVVQGPCDGQTLGVVGEAGAAIDYAMVFESDSLPEFESIYAGLLTELEPAG